MGKIERINLELPLPNACASSLSTNRIITVVAFGHQTRWSADGSVYSPIFRVPALATERLTIRQKG